MKAQASAYVATLPMTGSKVGARWYWRVYTGKLGGRSEIELSHGFEATRQAAIYAAELDRQQHGRQADMIRQMKLEDAKAFEMEKAA